MEIFTSTEIIVSSKNEINLYKNFISWSSSRSRLDLKINNTKFFYFRAGNFSLGRISIIPKSLWIILISAVGTFILWISDQALIFILRICKRNIVLKFGHSLYHVITDIIYDKFLPDFLKIPQIFEIRNLQNLM